MTEDSGFILIDKPLDWTSHDVVAKLRGVLGTRKIGHGGTLDPLASGLLILGVNQGTKLLRYILGSPKTYRTTIRLGQSTPTDDAAVPVQFQATPGSLAAITADQIEHEIAGLTGAIQQRPSSFSAMKIKGKRAYELAREGVALDLPSRPVTIHEFSHAVVERTDQYIDIEAQVHCSSGTYIRALARDLGERLGVGGHLQHLRRWRIGNFALADAFPIEAVSPRQQLLSLGQVAKQLMDHIEVSLSDARGLTYGQRPKGLRVQRPTALLSPAGQLVAIVAIEGNKQVTHAVFMQPEEIGG